MITCWDGSCSESATDCPEATCSDTQCSLWLNTYTCPQIEEIYGYDCSICEEEGSCPITCEDEGLVTCPTGVCANSDDECNTCENSDEANEGINYSDGYDQYYYFTIPESVTITLSTAGAGIDTKLYLYATCDDVDIDNFPYGDYIAYSDDWGSSEFGECPDCEYWGESYINVGIPAGDYIIVSSDQYNYSNQPFEWTLGFDTDNVIEGCTNPYASNYDPLANVDDGSCEFIEGCTNPYANNYDPEAYIDDGSCEFDDGTFFIICDDGSYQSEVSWDLINNETGDIVLSGGAPFYSLISLDQSTYYISAFDSFGDGWNNNMWTIVSSESNDEIFSYTLTEGSEGVSDTFNIETGCNSGDLNNDGIINILDVLTIVNAIITESVTEEILDCGDMNDDGLLNVLDVLEVINIILE